MHERPNRSNPAPLPPESSARMKLGCLSGVALVDSGRGEVDDRIVHRHAGVNASEEAGERWT